MYKHQKTQPYFSVCIPTYNRAQMLAEAIESVLDQDLDDFELIVCDNASEDESQCVVTKYLNDKRFQYVRYDNLVSMYANHNRCLKLASSDWIIFLHSDDIMRSLKSAKSIIEEFPSTMSACFPNIEEQNILYKKWSFIELLQLMNGISPSGSIYKKKILNTVNGFNESNIIADWEVLLDIALEGGEVYSYAPSEIIVQRRTHGKNAYYKSIKDGSAHQGKMQCVSRIFSRIEPEFFKHIVPQIVKGSTPKNIALLYCYLLLSNYQNYAFLLKETAKIDGKYKVLSPGYFYALIGGYFGKESFLKFYQIAKSFIN